VVGGRKGKLVLPALFAGLRICKCFRQPVGRADEGQLAVEIEGALLFAGREVADLQRARVVSAGGGVGCREGGEGRIVRIEFSELRASEVWQAVGYELVERSGVGDGLGCEQGAFVGYVLDS